MHVVPPGTGIAAVSGTTDVAVATELLESVRVSETIAQRADDLDVDLIVTGELALAV